MKLVNEDLLDTFRKAPRCEYCLAPNIHGLDPAHIYSRGAGRVDIPENLVALCRRCHSAQGARNGPSIKDLELLAALRLGIMPEDIFPEVCRIRRLTKEGKEPR